MIGEKGEYFVNDAPPKKSVPIAKEDKPKKPPVAHRTRNITGLVDAVHQWPQFPGGGDAFMKYLQQIGNDLVKFLPSGVNKTYIQVEFIIDKDGTPTNFKVLKGASMEDVGDELISLMEKMPTWQPALLHDKPVPKKMVQTVTIEASAN